MVTNYGKCFLFGCQVNPGVIQGIPAGAKVRLRMRNTAPAVLYIRDAGSLTAHVVESVSGTSKGPWKVGHAIGENKRWVESDGWIPVTEQMPDDSLTVLIASNDPKWEPVWTGWYDSEHGTWRNVDAFPVQGITHWKHFPEPPAR